MKKLLPTWLRDQLRPGYLKMQTRLLESSWFPKPAAWREFKMRLNPAEDLEGLFSLAREEFGITQIPGELFPFLRKVKEGSPAVIGEVGTHKGGNSFLFSQFLKPQHLFCIDLKVQNRSKLKYYSPRGQETTIIDGDSTGARTLATVRQSLRGRQFDFLFIDGDHSYAGVRRDFETYYDLVKDGGVIAFHDILPDHHTLYGKATNCYAGGVHLLWKELKERFHYIEFVADYGQDGFGIGMIEKTSIIRG